MRDKKPTWPYMVIVSFFVLVVLAVGLLMSPEPKIIQPICLDGGTTK